MNIQMPYNIWAWRTFTPTGGWTTATTYTGAWCRVGDSLHMRFRMAFSGTPDAGDLTVNLPAGLSIDTTKMNGTTAATQILGHGRILDSGAGSYVLTFAYSSATAVSVLWNGTGNSGFINRTNPISFGAGGGTDEISGYIIVPIAGWAA